jgi:hypothetical protein
MFPVLMLIGAAVAGSAVVRYGAVGTLGGVAAARERHHDLNERTDTNERYEAQVAKAMGKSEAEYTPVELSPSLLPASLRRFSGPYLLTPRDVVVLTYAIASEQARENYGEIGELLSELSSVTGIHRSHLEHLLYANSSTVTFSLPALLQQMRDASNERMKGL